jgi:hypothetical protein
MRLLQPGGRGANPTTEARSKHEFECPQRHIIGAAGDT